MIDIILLTCNRINLLQQIIAGFQERLRTPYRLIVVDNNSKDGTTEYLKGLKNIVFIHNNDSEERGICGAYNQGLKFVESELFITTQDDLLIPDLEPDALTQLIDLFTRNPEFGAICLRTVDQKRGPYEGDELIRKINTCPGVFRIQRKSDIEKIGGFGSARRWEDSEMVRIMANIGKKCAIASNLWVKDLGLASDRGYPDWYRKSVKVNYNRNFEWVARDRRQRKVSKINPKTHEPININ
jgi:glycosyltransferase involved in cell wall biosynthesis